MVHTANTTRLNCANFTMDMNPPRSNRTGNNNAYSSPTGPSTPAFTGAASTLSTGFSALVGIVVAAAFVMA